MQLRGRHGMRFLTRLLGKYLAVIIFFRMRADGEILPRDRKFSSDYREEDAKDSRYKSSSELGNNSFDYAKDTIEQMPNIIEYTKLSVWDEFGQPLNGTTNHVEHGRHVSLSYDGRLAAVSGTDTVNIWRFSRGSWTLSKNLSDHLESNGEGYYTTVMSSNGNMVAVGAPNNDFKGPDKGSVQIFEKSYDDYGKEQWTQLGETQYGDSPQELLGHSVSLTEDGLGALLGGYGAAVVKYYRLTGLRDRRWVLKYALKGNIQDGFGYSTAMSGSGSTIAVGAPFAFGKKGFFRLIDIDSFDYITQFKGDHRGDCFGFAVTISLDGSRAACGSWQANEVYAYQYIDAEDGWQQIGTSLEEEENRGMSSAFGKSISLSEDGSVIAIGAPWYTLTGPLSGRVRTYEINPVDNRWAQVGPPLDGENTQDECGESVALSPNGKKVAMGCPGYDMNGFGFNVGHVKIFNSPGSQYVDDDSFTVDPSTTPSYIPSHAPSVNQQPVVQPSPLPLTESPSLFPTDSPTISITNEPTTYPTTLTTSPSMQPSDQSGLRVTCLLRSIISRIIPGVSPTEDKR